MSNRVTRRDLLRGSAAAFAMAACGGRGRSEHKTAPSDPLLAGHAPFAYSGRPHYVLEVLMMGGVDAVLTLDPRDQSAVGDTIHCGYRGDERVKGSRRLFGPLIGDLMRHDDDMCIVHGVRVDTVSHIDGMNELLAGKVAYHQSGWVAPVISERLPGGAPIAQLSLSCERPSGNPMRDDVPCCDMMRPPPSGEMGSPVIASAEGLLRMAEHMRTNPAPWRTLTQVAGEQAIVGANPEEAAETKSQTRRQLATLELMRQVPLPHTFKASPLGPALSIALEAFRGNIARYVQILASPLWFDSHTDNYSLQRQRVVPAYADIAAMLDALKRTRNEFGPLIEQTTVVIGGEMGRFPKLNHSLGKDHFPETSWILLGRGVRGGRTVGATNEHMQGLPINYATGAVDHSGRTIPLDSIYATLCHLTGADLAAHGYDASQVLTCVKA